MLWHSQILTNQVSNNYKKIYKEWKYQRLLNKSKTFKPLKCICTTYSVRKGCTKYRTLSIYYENIKSSFKDILSFCPWHLLFTAHLQTVLLDNWGHSGHCLSLWPKEKNKTKKTIPISLIWSSSSPHSDPRLLQSLHLQRASRSRGECLLLWFPSETLVVRLGWHYRISSMLLVQAFNVL